MISMKEMVERQAHEKYFLHALKKNAELRELALQDVSGALLKFQGVCWDPERVKVSLIEEEAGTIKLVIPAIHTAANDDELDDDLLDMVAGGTKGDICCSVGGQYKCVNQGYNCPTPPAPSGDYYTK